MKKQKEFIPVDNLPSYDDVAAMHNPRDHRYTTVRDLWDDYRSGWKYCDKNVRVLSLLKKAFSNDVDCSKMQPFGNFKDLAGMSHREIYDSLVSSSMLKREYIDSVHEITPMSIADAIPLAVGRAIRESSSSIQPLSRTEIIEGYAMMLYHSSIGICGETKTIKQLNARFKSHGDITVVAADASEECYDIDAWLCVKDKRVIPISIKCQNSLNERTISVFRNKGKVKPMMYAGINTDGELGVIYSPYKSGSDWDYNRQIDRKNDVVNAVRSMRITLRMEKVS